MNRYKKLNIWNRAVEFATQVYKSTSNFPAEEKYGLTSQIRRCVVSISSNIAEGAGRSSEKDFKRFINIAYSSSCELETQLIIATNLKLLSESESIELLSEINELQKMIFSLSKKLQT